MSINYISTRGAAPTLGFEDAVLAGLATDGGLYVPDSLPQFAAADIAAMKGLPYTELAYRIIAPFAEESIGAETLKEMIAASYATFRHPEVAPLVQLEPGHFVLELFHGPTLAFKDFALQFLGRLLDHILQKRGQRATVVGATSGDTGSAAIEGCRGRSNIRIFILHPHGRTSDVQRKQMTTVRDAGVHNLAVKGTFDDCQDVVKTLFGDSAFREKHKLAAVNSINWARILAQIVYYFYAAVKVGAPEKRVSFTVPTGNFGDIFAGYLAGRMGLPIERLIIASNRNDILTRTLSQGNYAMQGVAPSLSPSMDIQVSSNFERLLFDLYARDGKKIAALMREFREKGTITLSPEALKQLRSEFDAHATDDAGTLAVIAEVYKTHGYLLDPHSAVGVAAARACKGDVPMITLATAHPAKFPDAVQKATGVKPPLPNHMADLFSREERFEVIENSVDKIKAHIEANA